jgi:hypothetical protein
LLAQIKNYWFENLLTVMCTLNHASAEHRLKNQHDCMRIQAMTTTKKIVDMLQLIRNTVHSFSKIEFYF